MTPYYDHAGITIYHGDCREILPTMGAVDLVLTDPPYGIGYDSRGGEQLAPRRKYDIPTVKGDNVAFDPTFLLATGKRRMIWGAEHFMWRLPRSGRLLIWHKRIEKSEPDSVNFADAEIAWDSKGTLNRVIRHVQEGFINDGYGVGVGRVHPTQKPEAVMMWCLRLARECHSVVDPFMGSGTTLRAAKDLGRRAIGIEIEERYCEIAAKRLSQEVFNFA